MSSRSLCIFQRKIKYTLQPGHTLRHSLIYQIQNTKVILQSYRFTSSVKRNSGCVRQTHTWPIFILGTENSLINLRSAASSSHGPKSSSHVFCVKLGTLNSVQALRNIRRGDVAEDRFGIKNCTNLPVIINLVKVIRIKLNYFPG